MVHTCGEEIEHRVGAAAKVISRSNEKGGTRKKEIEERQGVYDAMVVPTILYGCETWTAD